jgi:cytochrome c
MKRILALGAFALFIACNSSTEKKVDSDTSSAMVSDTTPVVNSDTSVAVNPEPSTAPVEVSKSVETKTPDKNPKTAAVTKAPAQEKPVQAPDNGSDTKKGEMLISKSDCFACHKIQEKLVGPAYKDVANKYSNTKANIDYLIAKVKNGGSGVWGPVPMTPHPALSDDDLKSMIQYILSLK